MLAAAVLAQEAAVLAAVALEAAVLAQEAAVLAAVALEAVRVVVPVVAALAAVRVVVLAVVPAPAAAVPVVALREPAWAEATVTVRLARQVPRRPLVASLQPRPAPAFPQAVLEAMEMARLMGPMAGPASRAVLATGRGPASLRPHH